MHQLSNHFAARERPFHADVRRFRSTADPREGPSLGAVKYDRLWERLIEYISEWASVREVPGGIEVTFAQSPGVTRNVEVVVTSADWDDYVSIMYGTGDPRATTLKEEVLATPDGARYLVYDTYEWVPSVTRELPEDDFDPGPGEWVVRDDDGNVIERFADFDEQD